MSVPITPAEELLASARTTRGVWTEGEILDWLARRSEAHRYSVELTPLSELQNWAIEPTTGNVVHASGKFFSVIGLDVRVSGVGDRHWSQPIVFQPEVGILGFVAKRIDGVLHLLVQAKMEPGNVNLVQLSPTVQATRSNYSQVHGGRRPEFLEYFAGDEEGVTLLDQLQSEQGTRYYRKRNRNVIVRVADDAEIPEREDFVWVTIGQLTALMAHPNLIHLDSRSVLGSLCLAPGRAGGGSPGHRGASGTFSGEVLRSLAASDSEAEHTIESVLGWLARQKIERELDTRLVPLRDVEEWSYQDGVIRHASGHFFSVVGVDVKASSREVASWSQPLIRSEEGGIIGLAVQRRRGVLHLLIQARLEPGLIDGVELAPTVQCSPINYGSGGGGLPPFLELFGGADGIRVRLDTRLSDEGGRFYHSEQRHVVIELEPELPFEVPPDFRWMTVGQVHQCVRFSSVVNIELRSLMACLPVA